MPKLSSAAWIVHDLGLAAAIGGSLFGRTALDPALKKIRDPKERDQVNQAAWSRYGAITLVSHAAMAAPWLIGRFLLRGREVSGTARSLTRAKDIMVGISLVTCAASAILGRAAAPKQPTEPGPEEAHAKGNGHGDHDEARRKVAIDRTLDAVGLANLVANAGIVGVTAALAMEGGKSARFALKSRRLP